MKKDRDAFILVLLTHYFVSCLDIALMGILCIWGAITLKSDKMEVMFDGFQNFVLVTTINVIAALVYILVHVCSLPIFICCMVWKPDLRERFQYQQNWHEDSETNNVETER